MVDRLAVLLGALAVAVAGLALVWGRPRLLALGWLSGLIFLPVWAGIAIYIGLEPATYLGLPVLALLLLSCPVRFRTPWTVVDLLVLTFFATCLLAGAFGPLSLDASSKIGLKWGLGYLLGRAILARVEARWLYGAFAVLMGIAAAFGIAEFVTGSNPFYLLVGPDGAAAHQAWAAPQIRGGLLRVSAGFGHSIAFGCALAFAVPLLFVSRLSGRLKMLLGALIAVALVLTFSRLGLGAAVVALLITMCSPAAQVSRRTRIAVLSCTAVAAAAVAPFISSVFDDAGSEASDSADYRDRLWALVPTVQFIGRSTAASVGPSGTPYYGSFRSIDNAVLLIALIYGALPLLLLAVLYAGACIRLLRGRYSAPLAGLVALGPAFVSVALITQFETLVWFAVGLSCAAVAQDHAARTQAAPAVKSGSNPALPQSVRGASDAGSTAPTGAGVGAPHGPSPTP